MKNSEGSTWKKWDLHFHTPASFDYKKKSLTNEQIIKALHKEEISAVAITDHHVIDVDNIKALQALGEPLGITVFPGIEFRSEIGGSESVHFIGIFPETCNVDHVWDILKGKLNLTPAGILEQGGDDHVYCDLKDTCKIIHELDGLVSIHAGKKSNSLENITNSLSHKIAQKLDVVKCIDIFEVGQVKDIKSYEEIVFPKINCRLPLILCSDNHDASDYIAKCAFWVKADNNFDGLKQIIHEPDRVFVGEMPEILTRVRDNPTKYIQSIKITKEDDAKTSEKWFEGVSIELNPELVTIIGNKGHGKSALLDIIALLGNVKGADKYSFLTDRRFKKSNKASNFRAEIFWHDGQGQQKNLGTPPDDNLAERVKYIPQQFLEKLCNEQEEDFLQELKKVIFSHIPKEDRLNSETIDDLLSNKSEIILADIENIKLSIHAINNEIFALEKKGAKGYLLNLQDLLNNKLQELRAAEQTKPDEVKDPALNSDATAAEALGTNIAQINDQIANLTQEIASSQTIKSNNNIVLGNMKKMLQEIKSFESLHQNHKTTFSKLLQNTEIYFDQLITVQTDTTPVLEEISKREMDNSRIEDLLNPAIESSFTFRLKASADKKHELEQVLDGPSRTYQKYLTDLLAWQMRVNAIQGNADEDGTISYYENQISFIENELQEKIDNKRSKRLELTKGVFVKKGDLIKVYSELYKPVDAFIGKYEEILKNYPISLNVSLKKRDLEGEFFGYVSHGVKGSFCGKEPGQENLKNILRGCDLNTFDGCELFLNAVIQNLEFDTRPGLFQTPREIQDQIRPNKTTAFYDFLFELDYLEPAYALMLADKDISQLSPGEKGALLLIFYLTLDKSDTPLLIDQPEENLDNQSVYEILVPFIKRAKLNRQIIIVTHNPNIAVVCDSEQVISTSIDKLGGHKVNIVSGGIENSDINARIVEVLEGTMPAFTMRNNKYSSTIHT